MFLVSPFVLQRLKARFPTDAWGPSNQATVQPWLPPSKIFVALVHLKRLKARFPTDAWSPRHLQRLKVRFPTDVWGSSKRWCARILWDQAHTSHCNGVLCAIHATPADSPPTHDDDAAYMALLIQLLSDSFSTHNTWVHSWILEHPPWGPCSIHLLTASITLTLVSQGPPHPSIDQPDSPLLLPHTQMNVNIPYADMVRPLQGSENPFGDQNRFLNQNALAGHVEEQAMSDHAFKAQHLTHAILGYSANPSVDPNASALVGSLDKARENGFTTIDTLRASRTQKKELKRKWKSKGDLDVIDGEDAYVGPWAAWDGEHQAGFLDSVEELPEGQAQEEEEEGPEPSVPRKKAKPKRGAGNVRLPWQVHDRLSAPHLHASSPHGGTSSRISQTRPARGHLHPEGHLLLSGSMDTKIKEYDQHLGPANTIMFVDKNRRFVMTSDDKMIWAQWDFDIPVVIKYIAELHMHSMTGVTLHPSKRYFAAQSLDNQILVYSTDNFQQNWKKWFAEHSVIIGYACQVGFSPDGKWISSGDSTGDVVFWDWKTGRMKARLKAHSKVVVAHEWLPHETDGVFHAFEGATLNGYLPLSLATVTAPSPCLFRTPILVSALIA
ncbi:hypothetical protein SCLCIDRAFT_23135 [Scleroderma citrinum Foug A]|uniref:Uncharacterized protein n=1 Tax=Scleroderma citrinum Foug A TaxID=1036808 RepID=A0A0C3DWT9_9AGAM|nr:hypothetical protein SCLCIDRAFT_23135 [Scleroderma citrinum Foug A]